MVTTRAGSSVTIQIEDAATPQADVAVLYDPSSTYKTNPGFYLNSLIVPSSAGDLVNSSPQAEGFQVKRIPERRWELILSSKCDTWATVPSN